MRTSSEIKALIALGCNVVLESKHTFSETQEFAALASTGEGVLTINGKGFTSSELEALAAIGEKHITIVVE